MRGETVRESALREGSTLDGGWVAIALAQLIATVTNVWRTKNTKPISPGDVITSWGALPHLAAAIKRAEADAEAANQRDRSDEALLAFVKRWQR